MLIDEVILDEDVTETKDLMSIAYYLEGWLTSKRARENFKGFYLTLNDIEHLTKQPLPKFQSKIVKYAMLYPGLGNTGEPLKIAANDPNDMDENEAGAYFPNEWEININVDLIQKYHKSVASTILHELQHALDDYKSSGKALTSKAYSSPEDNRAAYLAHPSEINARFSQALWMLASNYETISRSDVYPAIVKVFTRYNLTSEVIPDKNERKRLVTRAYKFLDEVIQIVNNDNPTKQGFVQKVKALIRKWLPL